MQTTFIFKAFKPFAQNLLETQLSALTKTYYKHLYDAGLPILAAFESLSQQQRLEQTRELLQVFLESVLQDRALEEELAAAERWYRNQMDNYSREHIQASDLVLFYSVRHRLWIEFLPVYTQDLQTGLDILKEYEAFNTLTKKWSFQVWQKIQEEEVKKVRQHQAELLEEKNKQLEQQKDELLSMLSELKASNDELQEVRHQLEFFNNELEERVSKRTQELEYQRQWLYNLFMQVPGLIGILAGEEGTVVLSNDAFSRLWGGRQVLGLPMRQAWPELEEQGYFEFVEEVMRNGKALHRQEYPGLIDRNNDGQLHQAFFNFVFLPYLNPNGETEGVIIYGVDVSEQVEARIRVERSEEQLRLALEAGQMGIWDYDPEQNTSYNSPLFYKIFGYPEPIPNWNYTLFMQHVLPECRAAVAENYLSALNNGKLLFETKIEGADGEFRWILIRGKIFFSDKNKPIRISGVVTDITERKKAEEALHQSHQELQRINTDLDNFIYTASHDLRSPIINLESLLSLLLHKQSQTWQANDLKILHMMSTSTGRLKRTIDALTDITRIQKEDERKEEIPLQNALQEVEEDLASRLEESQARLVVSLQVESIRFVPHNLRSILYNLVSNAIKYRKPQEPLLISIESYQEGDFTVLSVADNGMGISEANQKKLFSMFKRFHTHVKGSGIGLYLIKRIIENAGGCVEAESKEGCGSTFRVFFPRQ